ncbi:MAG: hypothetical protein JNK56_08225 [Myxococcales bacterium]|nr:hypothetical protein [Myxococcales bacterium]
MSDPQGLPEGAQIVAGPERVGSEQRWRVRLADGRAALLARLAPELARDLALRRRYVRDLARLQALTRDGAAPGVAPVLALGPEAEAAAEDAPPWRLRLDPPGETLEAWLARRAPLPPDEAGLLGIALAELLTPLHERGAVLRDLHPRLIVRGEDRLWLTDVGLGRVDILSTRTAASLLLEGSPYAAPEQLQRTALDPRADLYPLGVILYRALTGLLPRGDGPAFLVDDPVAPVSRLRPEVPAALDRLVLRCLELDPVARPASARELAAALRGEIGPDGEALARVVCQHCKAPLRLGQRLCLACGRVAVDFAAEPGAESDGRTIQLRDAKEDTAFLAHLYDTLSPLHDGVLPQLNFVIGDARMYSKAELERRIRLPVPLFSGLAPATAERLAARLKQGGLRVRVVDDRRRVAPSRARIAAWTAGGFAVPAGLALVLGAPFFVHVILFMLAAMTGVIVHVALRRRRSQRRESLLKLRRAPALPASDPLVARLAALLGPATRPELRELVGGLALAVQRLVDHRAAAPGARAELDALTGPVAPLVDLVVAQVGRLGEIDGVLAGLDEGELMRALAVSEARGEPAARRHDLLLGLDRLRGLEDERAAIFHRLLEAESLLRRAVEVGLGVRDEDAGQARAVDQALHVLTRGEG